MGQLDGLEKMTSVWGRGCPQKKHNSKALTGSSSHILNNVDQDHKILQKSNKSSNKPPTRPPEASAIDVVRYIKKDLQSCWASERARAILHATPFYNSKKWAS